MNIRTVQPFGNTIAELDTDLLNKGRVLTETDIRYIAEQAKAEKKTIARYLEDIGFNTGSDRYQGKAPLLFDGNYVDEVFRESDGWIGSWAFYTSKYAKVYGYRMENTSDYARTDRNLISCWRSTVNGTTEKKCQTSPVEEKLGLYLVMFVSRDFADPHTI